MDDLNELVETFRDALRQIAVFDNNSQLVSAAERYLEHGSVDAFADVMRLSVHSPYRVKLVACFADHGLYMRRVS